MNEEYDVDAEPEAEPTCGFLYDDDDVDHSEGF